jgi:hypothetical protein
MLRPVHPDPFLPVLPLDSDGLWREDEVCLRCVLLEWPMDIYAGGCCCVEQ